MVDIQTDSTLHRWLTFITTEMVQECEHSKMGDEYIQDVVTELTVRVEWRIQCGFTLREVPLVCVQQSSCKWYVTHSFGA